MELASTKINTLMHVSFVKLLEKSKSGLQIAIKDDFMHQKCEKRHPCQGTEMKAFFKSPNSCVGHMAHTLDPFFRLFQLILV